MLVIAALLVACAVVVGFFSHQNAGSHDVSLFGFQWSGVYDWVPVAIAAGVVGLLCILAVAYAGARMRRLQAVNAQLRSEIDLLRAVPVTTPASLTPTGRLLPERDVTGRRFGWFGRGSRQQQAMAREHTLAEPPAASGATSDAGHEDATPAAPA